MGGNQYTAAKIDLANGLPISDRYANSIRNAKKRNKKRSDIGKKHHKKGEFVSEAFTIEDLERTYKEIQYWERWERRRLLKSNGEKSEYQKERARMRNRVKMRQRRQRLRESGAEPNKDDILRRRADTLAARYNLIPSSFICPCCNERKINSRQWVVDLKAETAICKVCYGVQVANKIKRDKDALHSVEE